MLIPVTQDLITIFRQILQSNKSLEEWSEIESDDMFHRGSYEGGFDATEQAFCFSFYDSQGAEFWFQLTLEEIMRMAADGQGEVEARPAFS